MVHRVANPTLLRLQVDDIVRPASFATQMAITGYIGKIQSEMVDQECHVTSNNRFYLTDNFIYI